jgi:hypothetical protein
VLLALPLGLSHAAAPHEAPASAPALDPNLEPVLALHAPGGPQPITATLTIELTITNAAALGGFEFDLVYEPALLQVSGLSLSGFLGTVAGCDPEMERCAVELGPQAKGDATALGAYSYGAGGGGSGDGLLALIELTPTGATGTSALHIANPLLASADGIPSVPSTHDTWVTLWSEPPRHLYLPLSMLRYTE